MCFLCRLYRKHEKCYPGLRKSVQLPVDCGRYRGEVRKSSLFPGKSVVIEAYDPNFSSVRRAKRRGLPCAQLSPASGLGDTFPFEGKPCRVVPVSTADSDTRQPTDSASTFHELLSRA